jgi:hypothetical protein
MLRIYPKLRLHSALRGARGITVVEAIERATTEMDVWSDDAFVEIDAAIGDIRRMCAAGADAMTPQQVFARAEVVVKLAGLFSPPLCKAGQSLCNLAQKAMNGAPLDRGSVSVHAESMILLRGLGDQETKATVAILDGLYAVVAKAG